MTNKTKNCACTLNSKETHVCMSSAPVETEQKPAEEIVIEIHQIGGKSGAEQMKIVIINALRHASFIDVDGEGLVSVKMGMSEIEKIINSISLKNTPTPEELVDKK